MNTSARNDSVADAPRTGAGRTPAESAHLAPATPGLATTDEAIRHQTGRGWDQWFAALDRWGARDHTHREIARWVAHQTDLDPLAWGAQAVAGSYERVRGLRAPGQHAETFTATASRTIEAPVATLYAAVADPAQRARWMPVDELRERRAEPWKTIDFDWGDGTTRVHAVFDACGASASRVSLRHDLLADGDACEESRLFWREGLIRLRELLEHG
ncbi:hypothetical protein G4H71_19375 [Rhodococcus triatomae]|uniref:Activator of Hsp90 ATPase homolog 1-like protein n=1 Tax=Rhodococcus triatomae TaxID=300028 RepID=A0A1G8Q6P7_9NOCA|nr:hypothetical protein [Rhodococcus triatomae]QNG19169.1 hypothetical protein G4H72_11005 [Rhodococcus triatomae]QNG24919.1 hypothetical protein G4H71_19375 [Rhodococcus triatomae]SDJ00479.1 hypothetical protein SAMN05444695_11490 [Rhodococcus triatomae]